MATMDQRNWIADVQAFRTQVLSTAEAHDGAVVNVQGHRWLRIVLNVGTIGATTTAVVTVQKRTGSATFANITDAVFPTMSSTVDDANFRGLIDLERVVFAPGVAQDLRLLVTVTGTNGVPIGGVFHFSGAQNFAAAYGVLEYAFALTSENV